MKKISKTELLAILAAAGVSSGSMAIASDGSDSTAGSLGKVEHTSPSYLGDESKCGKGSCGKDEKGAEAAKEKKAKKEKKSKKEAKKDGEKSCKSGEKSCKSGEKSCKSGEKSCKKEGSD